MNRMFGQERFIRDVDELNIAVLPRRVRAERFHEIGEAVNLDGRESVAVDGCVVADRAVEYVVAGEVRHILIEIRAEAVCGNDRRILFETPALCLLLSWQKLQARRFDRGEALFLPRR